MRVHIRPAEVSDAETIHRFVLELAAYEREPNAVEATVADFATQLAAYPPPFECVIAELDREPVGFALFFYNYSTWKARRGLYLEDLYVTPSARNAGVGHGLFTHLARLAVDRGCARMEWSVLTWNENAIRFYEKHGATAMRDWTPFRIAGAALSAAAAGDPAEDSNVQMFTQRRR